MSSTLTSLRNLPRDTSVVVSVVSGSHFINHMFLVLLPPVFGVLAVQLDVSLTELGIAVGAMSLFSAVFQLPFGYLSDNYSRPFTFGLGLGLAGVGALVLAAAQGFTGLLVGQAIVGTGLAAHHPVNFPLLSEATEEDNRGKAFSVHAFAANLGYGAAPALIVGTFAVPGLNWRHAFVAVGLLSAAYAVFGTVLLLRHVAVGRLPFASDESPEGSLSDRLRSNFAGLVTEARKTLASPVIIGLALLAMFSSVAGWGIRSFTVVLLTDGYDLSLSLANSTFSALFVASALLTLVGGGLADRFTATSTLLAGFGLMAASLAAVATGLVAPAVAMLLVVLAGGGLAIGFPARSKLTDKVSARDDLGKNFAVITVGVTVGGSVAPPIYGIITERTAVTTTFYVVAGFALVAVLITLAVVYVSGGRSDAEADAAEAAPDP